MKYFIFACILFFQFNNSGAMECSRSESKEESELKLCLQQTTVQLESMKLSDSKKIEEVQACMFEYGLSDRDQEA